MRTPHCQTPAVDLHAEKSRQRGIATVLIMLVVGMSLTAGVLGTMYFVKGTQDQTVSVHSLTQAQLKAWTGVEVVRQYLKKVQTDGQLGSLAGPASPASAPVALAFTGVSDIEAGVVEVTPTRITVDITGLSASAVDRAKATSTIRVVYGIQSAAASAAPRPAVMTFNRNLRLGGSITLLQDASSTTQYEINVLGDMLTSGNSITGVNKINALGSINIGSGSAFVELHSNCDIRLDGSVSTQVAKARRNICMTGAARASVIAAANGSVLAESGFNDNGILAGRNRVNDLDPFPAGYPVACQAANTATNTTTNVAGTCATPVTNGVDVNGGGAGAKSVRSPGNVALGRGGRIGELWTTGNLSVGGGGVINRGTVTVGTLTPATIPNVVRSTITVSDAALDLGATPVLPVGMVYKVPNVALQTGGYNAYDEELAANYVFKVDNNGYKKVTVRNVTGIAPGVYFLGNYAGANKDYLCNVLAAGSTPASPTCSAPAVSATKTICKGYSTSNNCFSYNSSTSTWTIAGISMAQGVAWFEGNLVVSNGTYYNTFIATRNILTSGGNSNYSPNYAGYDGRQNGVTYAPTGICVNSHFPDIYPAQFCNKTTITYDGTVNGGIGNFAYKSGSVPPGTTYSQATYVGGQIELGSSSIAYGSVLAGNEFISGGSTTVHGYISALALGVKVANSAGGSTTINLRNLPPGFTPQTGGGAGGSGGGGVGGGSGGAGTNDVVVQWSKYL